MSIEDRMTIDERRKYLRKMQERYLEADRPATWGLACSSTTYARRVCRCPSTLVSAGMAVVPGTSRRLSACMTCRQEVSGRLTLDRAPMMR
jgi:hypothetical protein